MILNRRSFIKGLIRCVPAVVVPSLVFDCKPKEDSKRYVKFYEFRGLVPVIEQGETVWQVESGYFDAEWKWVNPGIPGPFFKPGHTVEIVGGELDLSSEELQRAIGILQKRA